MLIESSEETLVIQHSYRSPTMTSCENSPVKSSPSFPDDMIGSSEAMDHDDTIINQSTPTPSPLINLPIKSEYVQDHPVESSSLTKVHSSNDDQAEFRSVTSTPTIDALTSGSLTSSPVKNERIRDLQESCLDDSVSGQHDSSDLENKHYRDEFDILQSPSTASDKKIHWTNKQVHLLLDMVEQRLPMFKSRGVHANVWSQIGQEISAQYPQITTKHCYNKWKNLRRDVRLTLVNPNKSVRNADVLKRMSRLVTEMYPGDLDGISQVASPNASLTPFKKLSSCSPSPNIKKEKKLLRHPKLTSKHLARQFHKETPDSHQNNTMSDLNDQGIQNGNESSSNPNPSKFESLLSAAAQSLMQDLQEQQFRQNQSQQQLGENNAPSVLEQQQHSQNMTNSLINNGLTSLLINPALLLNSQLLNGLINQSLNQSHTPDPRFNNNNNDSSRTNHINKSNEHFTNSQNAHDLRVKSNPHLSPPTYNSATSISNNENASLPNGCNWTQEQIYELLDLLKTFHTEETRHTTLVEQMVEMALNLKAAAYRRLAALDELLAAFSNHQ